MNAKQVWERLRGQFDEGVVGAFTEAIVAGSDGDAALGKKDYRPRDAWTVVDAERLPEVCAFLAGEPDLAFDFLQCLTGVDYPTDGTLKDHGPENRIAVVYHLYSYTHTHTFVLKTFVDRDDPKVPTVCNIWPVANWHERETYDLFGVIFVGHPDLRRIMLPEEFEGHPCRKDYVERPTVLGIPTTRYSALNLMGRLVESD